MVLCAGLGLAQDAALSNPDKPSGITELDGKVASVDPAKHQIQVKDKHDHIQIIKLGHSTVISNSDSSKLTIKDIKENDHVHIYYTTANMTARQIDISGPMPILREISTH